MARIGVIVPAYNVKPYLEKCVGSILAQTFLDFELILVDDGSTDGSGALCDEYAERDKRVRVIHMEHGGVAAARNRGLEENQSEYIAFVDSDDWVARDYLETLYRLSEEHQADLLLSNGIHVMEGRRPRASDPGGLAVAERISRAGAYRCVLLNKGRDNASVVPWAKLYRRTVLRSVRYAEGEIYEDLGAIDQVIENSGRIIRTSYAGYYYFRRRGSIVHGRFTSGHLAAIRNAKRLWGFLRERYPELEDVGKVCYLRSCFDILNLMIVDPDQRREAERLRGEILHELRFFFSRGRFGPVERIGAVCLLPGLSWYRFAWRVYLGCTGKLSGTAARDPGGGRECGP